MTNCDCILNKADILKYRFLYQTPMLIYLKISLEQEKKLTVLKSTRYIVYTLFVFSIIWIWSSIPFHTHTQSSVEVDIIFLSLEMQTMQRQVTIQTAYTGYVIQWLSVKLDSHLAIHPMHTIWTYRVWLFDTLFSQHRSYEVFESKFRYFLLSTENSTSMNIDPL